MPLRRLLLIAERFPPDLGGVARSAARTAGALARLGVETHVLAWSRRLAPGQLESLPGELVAEAARGVTLHRLGVFGQLDYTLQHATNVLEWLHAQHAFEAVWGHYLFPAGFLAVMLAAQLDLPVTVSARGNDVDREMFPPGDFARLMWTLERARVISAVTHNLAAKIDRLLGRKAQVEVLGNVVDLATFRGGPADPALRASLGILPGEAVLGFCGELRHKKGLPFLLQALSDVRRVRPACLLVIGDVRLRDQQQLSTFAAEHPEAAARIVVSGQLDAPEQVAARLRLCDVVLAPSVWDGLPNAALEAMACERVLIASDAGGLPEAIEHGVNGFLLPRAQLHRLGEAALEILSLSPERQATFGRQARARIEADFCPAREEEALRKVLARLD